MKRVDVYEYNPNDFHPKVVAAISKMRAGKKVKFVVVTRMTDKTLPTMVVFGLSVASRLGASIGAFTARGLDVGMVGADATATFQYHFIK